MLQALLLPAVQGLRIMWNKKWEMVLPTAGLHLEMKLGNAWKKFFQSLRLVPSLEGSGLSCLRAEILGATFVYQQPLFSAHANVIGELCSSWGRTQMGQVWTRRGATAAAAAEEAEAAEAAAVAAAAAAAAAAWLCWQSLGLCHFRPRRPRCPGRPCLLQT